jgi:hypothetical protein
MLRYSETNGRRCLHSARAPSSFPFTSPRDRSITAVELPACTEACREALLAATSSGHPEAYVIALRALMAISSATPQAFEAITLETPPENDGAICNRLAPSIKVILVHLRKLFVLQFVAARIATEQPDLIRLLVQCMRSIPAVFHHAVIVAEILLVLLPSVYDLSANLDLSDIYEMMNSLSLIDLSHLCRVLCHVVFEPDQGLGDPVRILTPSELLALRMARHALEPSPIDRNHAVLLRSRLLMKKLVALLRLPTITHDRFNIMLNIPGLGQVEHLGENQNTREVLHDAGIVFANEALTGFNATTHGTGNAGMGYVAPQHDMSNDVESSLPLIMQVADDWGALMRLLS